MFLTLGTVPIVRKIIELEKNKEFMARKNRQVSRSGIYHVMLRGVNKQRIFENTDDYYAMYRILHFVQSTDTLRNPVEKPNFYLYAYCFMDNHIHLLIQPNGCELGELMKRLMTSYAIHFNNSYERVGHLFQDRYKSEVVEDRKYFFALLEYIHLNPVEAGFCNRPSLYRYSSFHEYNEMQFLTIGTVPDVRKFLAFPEDEQMLLGIRPEEMQAAVKALDETGGKLNLREELEQYIRNGNSTFCHFLKTYLDLQTPEETADTIVNTLLHLTGTKSITELQRLDKRTMRGALALVRDSGVSIRMLSRLTGISFSIIRTSYTDVVGKGAPSIAFANA